MPSFSRTVVFKTSCRAMPIGAIPTLALFYLRFSPCLCVSVVGVLLFCCRICYTDGFSFHRGGEVWRKAEALLCLKALAGPCAVTPGGWKTSRSSSCLEDSPFMQRCARSKASFSNLTHTSRPFTRRLL